MHQIDAKQTSKPPPSVAPDEENPRPENVRSEIAPENSLTDEKKDADESRTFNDFLTGDEDY
jgi:hypothetical protein